MQNDRLAGLALIGGTVAGLVTMAFHPTGTELAADLEHMSFVNQSVHALAIAGVIATSIGLLRMSRLLQHRALADAALVTYAFGAVAVMFAAIASGFIGTQLASFTQGLDDTARLAWEPVFDFNWALNQASTKVYVVLASVGIGLWSSAMLREPGGRSALGWTGLLVGVGATAAVLAGVTLDIHGFGAVVLGHGVWLVWTGMALMKRV